MIETEIVARRRKWTPAEKAALLAEIEAEGGRVSVVARRHGISDSLLYNWRSAWKAAVSMRNAGAGPQPPPVEFVPLGVIGPASDDCPGSQTASALDEPLQPPPLGGSRQQGRIGLIEIDLPNGARVRVDALVDETALQRVFRAMRGAGAL
jgi:transposase-like protein